MRNKIILSVCALVMAMPLAAQRKAPGSMPGSYTFIPKTDIEAMMGPTRGDRAIRVVPIGGGAQLGAFLLHYEKMKAEMPNSFYHSEINELYYVIRGEGTALLGGELENAMLGDPNGFGPKTITGPTVNGKMKGYTTQKWSAGDVIIVPAGVPHMIGWEVTVPNDILRVVVDPMSRLNKISSRAEALAQAAMQAPPQTVPPKPASPNMPGKFTYIPKADLEALMKGNIADTPARVVPTPKGSKLGAFVLHMEPRKPAGGPVTSFYHSEVTELYYVVRGGGTAMIGGDLENATWDDSNSASIKNVRGPSVNGTMKDAKPMKFAAGDAFIVTPGVPHSVTYEVNERTDIVRIVFDPKGSLELK